MSGIVVTPAQLNAAAESCRRAAETADGIVRAVNAARSVDTGRGDSTRAVLEVVATVTTALAGLHQAMRGDADTLSAAADTYVVTDGRVVPR